MQGLIVVIFGFVLVSVLFCIILYHFKLIKSKLPLLSLQQISFQFVSPFDPKSVLSSKVFFKFFRHIPLKRTNLLTTSNTVNSTTDTMPKATTAKSKSSKEKSGKIKSPKAKSAKGKTAKSKLKPGYVSPSRTTIGDRVCMFSFFFFCIFYQNTVINIKQVTLTEDGFQGIVRFIGEFPDKEVRYGIELEEAEDGMNNGTYKHYIKKGNEFESISVDYFSCADSKGYFVKQDRIKETYKKENQYNAPRLTVGDRVKCDEHKSDDDSFISAACLGTVRCVVLSKNEPNCIYYGIQLDAPNGHSNGRFEDVQFWEADEKCAVFLKMDDYDECFIKYSKKKESSSSPKEKKIKKSSSSLLKPVKKTRASSYESAINEDKKPKKKKKAVRYSNDDVKVEEIKKKKIKKKDVAKVCAVSVL